MDTALVFGGDERVVFGPVMIPGLAEVVSVMINEGMLRLAEPVLDNDGGSGFGWLNRSESHSWLEVLIPEGEFSADRDLTLVHIIAGLLSVLLIRRLWCVVVYANSCQKALTFEVDRVRLDGVNP